MMILGKLFKLFSILKILFKSKSAEIPVDTIKTVVETVQTVIDKNETEVSESTEEIKIEDMNMHTPSIKCYSLIKL